jgi:N-acetylglucosamine kinase-like BadF-type ATPase
MSYVLGVDGGASKTIALVARTDGTVVGMSRGGGSNIYDGDPDGALATGAGVALDALSAAGIAPADVAVGVFSMCGADWPEDFARIHSAMAHLGRQVVVVNDAVGGLRSGSPDGTGVAVVCGTGGATAARRADGRSWHTSFWQGAGGARDLARALLRAVYRADLGIDPPTALTPAALDFLAAGSVEEILHRATALDGPGLANRAELGRVLLMVAGDGDATARRIVAAHGDELGEYALAAARRVGLEGQPFHLVLAGGVFRHASPLLAEALVARVRRTSPGVTVIRSAFEPVVGALLLALEQHGALVDDEVLIRIRATMPIEHGHVAVMRRDL